MPMSGSQSVTSGNVLIPITVCLQTVIETLNDEYIRCHVLILRQLLDLIEMLHVPSENIIESSSHDIPIAVFDLGECVLRCHSLPPYDVIDDPVEIICSFQDLMIRNVEF